VDAVRTALQAGKCYLVVVASDAGPRAEEKVTRLARGKGLPVIVGPVADELGRVLGRPPVQAVGVSDRALASGVMNAGPAGQ
jgi:ribosomal protein L7Ae-like RNA K-turn-binding protein